MNDKENNNHAWLTHLASSIVFNYDYWMESSAQFVNTFGFI